VYIPVNPAAKTADMILKEDEYLRPRLFLGSSASNLAHLESEIHACLGLEQSSRFHPQKDTELSSARLGGKAVKRQ